MIVRKVILTLMNGPGSHTVQHLRRSILACRYRGGVHRVQEGRTVEVTPRNLVLEAADDDLFAYVVVLVTLQTRLQQGHQLSRHCLIGQAASCNRFFHTAIRIVYHNGQFRHLAVAVQGNCTLGQRHIDVVVDEGQVRDVGLTVVLQSKLVLNRNQRSNEAVVTGVNVVLITGLLGQHRGVNDLDVRLDTEVCGGTVTLCIVEVEVVSLAVLQTAHLSDIVQVDFCLGNGVRRTQVKHQLAIDEQVHVVVTGEGEVQVFILVVDELRVALHRQVVVGAVVVVGPVCRTVGDQIAVNVAGHTVAQICACTTHAKRVKTILGQLVTTDILLPTAGRRCPGDGFGLRVVNHTVCVIIFCTVVTGVEDVADRAVVLGLLHQIHHLVFADRLTVTGAVIEHIVQQEVCGIVPGGNAGIILQATVVVFCLSFCIGAETIRDLCADLGRKVGATQVTQLMTHDEIGIIGTILVLPLHCHGFLHIVRQIIHRSFGVGELLVGIQRRIDQTGTNPCAVYQLLRTARQRRRDRIRNPSYHSQSSRYQGWSKTRPSADSSASLHRSSPAGRNLRCRLARKLLPEQQRRRCSCRCSHRPHRQKMRCRQCRCRHPWPVSGKS